MRLTLLCLAAVSIAAGNPDCIQVPPTEMPPVERGTIATEAAASAETAQVGDTVQLTATAVADAVSFAWVQVAGYGVRLVDAGTGGASFAAPSLSAAQTLRFRVSSRNAAGDVGSAEVSVEVAADPNYGQGGDSGETSSNANRPVARPGGSQVVAVGVTVVLDGSASTGVNLRYLWRQVDGKPLVTLSGADTARATFVAPALPSSSNSPTAGDDSADFEFELVVTDSFGRTATGRVRVTVVRDSEDQGEGNGGNPDADELVRVLVTTSHGPFTLELNATRAPITVANFLRYTDEGFYDGTLFHRVVPGFVVQGGGFLPGLVEKETHDPIVNESDNGLKNVRGSVAMARQTEPDSATAQFYINLVDNAALDAENGADGYAVFGSVVLGIGVVDTIATVETEVRGEHADVPVEDVQIISVRRVTESSN